MARRRWAARIAFHPGRRLVAVTSAHAGLAAAMALWWPMLGMWLGPVLWGPAHVAADLRHLVARRGLRRAARYVVAGGGAFFVGLSLWRLAVAADACARGEMLAVAILLAAGSWAGAREALPTVAGRGWRLAAATFLAAAAGLAGAVWPRSARLAWVHGHNLVALLVLALFIRRRGRRAWPLPLGLVLVAAALATGAGAGATLAARGARMFGMHVLEASAILAPGLPTRYALGATSAFAFLQSVHYLVWLWAVPQQELKRHATPTFTASLRRLTHDLGRGAALAAAVVTALWAAALVWGPRPAASLYLSLAAFHGYMEATMICFFFCRGRI